MMGGFRTSMLFFFVVETAANEEYTAFEVLGGSAHLFFGRACAELVADKLVAFVEVRFEKCFAFSCQGDVDDATVGFARHADDELVFGETVDDRCHLLFGYGDLFGERAHVVGAEMLEHDERTVVVRTHGGAHVVNEIFMDKDECFE